jgi:hypothetical protein
LIVAAQHVRHPADRRAGQGYFPVSLGKISRY